MRLRLTALILCLFTTLCLAACVKAGPQKSALTTDATPTDLLTGNRPNPGLIQQFERQSMLFNSRDYARILSGSYITLRSSGSSPDPSELLGYADTWLFVNPLTLLVGGRTSIFDSLNDPTVSTLMREIGAKGIYVSPTRGSGSLWDFNKSGDATGEDVVTYDFAVTSGNANQYGRFINSLIEKQMILGMDMVPSFTGLGPDFFLAACNVREYPGVYCMIEVPNKFWSSLPTVAGRWEGVSLDEKAITALSTQGILPEKMLADISPVTRKDGWAATNEVPGIDGTKRRWVYRYHESPTMPVLNWEDPSRAAHKILSASVVLQTGLQGQSIIGLRFDAFQGLEAAPSDPGPADFFSLEPALSAAQSMSREIRRCGGWSWLRDENLPIPSISEYMQADTDLVYDSIFSPATEHALLTGDTTLLRFMADQLIASGLDSRRLVHATPNETGIKYSLTHLSFMANINQREEAAQLRAKTLQEVEQIAAIQKPTSFSDGVLFSTGAGISALGLGLSPEEVPDNKIDEVAKGHSLMIFFRAMQPGVLMLSGQDIVGALPLNWKSMVHSASRWEAQRYARGAYALSSLSASVVVTPQGVSKTNSIYGTADAQTLSPNSFLSKVGKFLRERSAVEVAKGRLVARPETKGKGTVALVTSLPSGGNVISVCNFSRSTVTETISLANVPGFKAGASRSLGGSGKYSLNGSTLTVTLGPWEGHAVLVGK